MVLRTTLSTARFAPAVARVVERGWPARGPMRVAEVRSNNASGIAFADAFFSSLRFNGKSALENGDRFTEIVFEDPGAEERVDVPGIVDRVVRARPDVVAFLDPTYFVPRVLPAIEAAWPKDAPRPRYASFGILQGEALGRALAARPDLSSRILTVEMRASRPANAKFAMRYNEIFTPRVTFDTAPGVTYDALYVLAYAAFASGAERPTGADLARATARLRGGAPLEVGPAKILEALRVLGEGGAIALEGAATRLDFDDRGEPSAELALYCVGKSEPPASVESGAFYDPAADAIVGTARCP
jgi:hypothetical protein